MSDHMRHIQDVLREANAEPGADNAPILIHEQQELLRLKNKGYPKHMYHPTLNPVVVMNGKQERAIVPHGYVAQYIPHEYPKALYRRNLTSPKLEKEDYVESRTARDAKHEKELRAERVRHGFTPWFYSIGELNAAHPLPDGPVDDPALIIAQLRGELEGYKNASGFDAASLDPEKRRPGRPRKAEEPVTA